MNFSWTPEQSELLDHVRRFCADALAGRPEHGGGSPTLWAERWRRCKEFGLLGLSVPVEHGGMGLDALSTAAVLEVVGECCRDSGLVFSACAHLFACAMTVAESGDPALKARYLPALASGELVGANAITEAEAGSDVFALKTSARRDGAAYVLNGVKSFVTNAPLADLLVVYASTNPKHGYWGISAFVVDRKTPGLRVGEPFSKIGLRSSPTAAVYLDDCRVPVENLVGAEGQGAVAFERSMLWERACLFAAWLGLMARQIDQVVTYARARVQFGKPIGKQQGLASRIVDMKLRLEASRLLLYRACWRKAQGDDTSLDVAISKLAVSEAAVRSSLDAIQVFGSNGVVTDYDVEVDLRDMVAGTIYSGTSEIQRNIIAARLGL